MIAIRRYLVLIVWSVVPLLLGVACAGSPVPETADQLTGALCSRLGLPPSWVCLPLPDSRFEPGTLLDLREDGDIDFLGDLGDCGVPESVLEPVTGTSSAVTLGSSSDFKAEAVLKLPGVEMGPEFSRLSKARLEVSKHGPRSISLVRLAIFLSDPANQPRVPEACWDLFSRGTLIVKDVWEISEGSFELLRDDAAAITLSATNVGDFLSLDPKASYGFDANGKLTFSERLSVAVKNVTRLDDGTLRTLGAGGGEEALATADAQLRELL